MPINVWKVSSINSTGNSLVFGTVDFNRVSNLLNGQSDVGDVEIDSNFAILQNRFKLQDNHGFNITISAPSSVLSSDLNLILPPLTADDALVGAQTAVELVNKTINLSSNVLKDTSAVKGDVLRHDGTSFKRLAKGAANTVLQVTNDGSDVYWGPGGTGIWSASFAETLSNKTIGIDSNTIKESITANNTTGAILVNNGTKYATRARGSLGTVLQASSTDLLYALIGDQNIGPHTTTKITITDKSLLNSALIYNDQDNNLGAHFQDIQQISEPLPPASGVRRLFSDASNNSNLSVMTDTGQVISLETIAASSWSASATETLTNKTIDPATNNIPNVQTFAGIVKTGHFYGTGAETGSGIFTQFLQQPNGTAIRQRTSASGIWQHYSTDATTSATCATRTLDTFVARAQNPTFSAKIRMPTTIANQRVYVGFTSDVTQDPKNGNFLDGKHGVMFCYGYQIGDGDGSTGHWYIMCNNGAGTSFLQSTGITAFVGKIAIVLKFDDVNNKVSWSINGGAFSDITTQVPASTTLMGEAWGIQTTTTSTRDLDVFYVDTTMISPP